MSAQLENWYYVHYVKNTVRMNDQNIMITWNNPMTNLGIERVGVGANDIHLMN